ncbi:MAG: hypothetical protein FWF34_03205, partial [Alphaproteobacteria bacterium]|nr:hypothetical protein [Alphaproteobacteria bacterium]
MQIERVLNLLQNSGFHVLGSDGTYIWIEDPTCFTRSIIDFINTVAWPVIVVITAFLLLGWAISLIRGAKTDIITNLRNLLLMFGILSLAMTIAGFIYGDDLSAQSCKKIGVPISEVQRILDSRNAKLRRWNADDLWEEFDIYDSAAGNEIPRMEWPDVELPTEYVELPPVDIGGGETITGMVVESR